MSLTSTSWLDLSSTANQFLESNLKNTSTSKKQCPSKRRFEFLGVPRKTHGRDGLANLSHIDCGPMQHEPLASHSCTCNPRLSELGKDLQVLEKMAQRLSPEECTS